MVKRLLIYLPFLFLLLSLTTVARASLACTQFLSNNIKVEKSTGLFIVNDKDIYWFNARLSNGVLTIDVFLKNNSGRSVLSGKVLFREMMDHFGPTNIRIVETQWHKATPDYNSVNYDSFTQSINKGFPISNAAKDTWTGKILLTYGFNTVANVELFHEQVTKSEVDIFYKVKFTRDGLNFDGPINTTYI